MCLAALAPVACAADYADELVARAEASGLAADPAWLRLLHFRKSVFGVLRSEADDPGFFNAPNGKTDPRAELAATLRAFFSDVVETDSSQNPQCRFIARYRWLRQRLGFDPARLPEQPCDRFNRWRSEIDPVSVTLVFPAAYINGPASMYGHTLLRLDGRAQTEKTRLLDYAVNFAAHTGRDNGLAFAWKGLFGGYDGRFSLTPYYVKIGEYSDLESRDIWEYRLAFTPEEIERIIEHVWELGPMRFDYYFLDENCSYQILWLLDYARPDLDLTGRFPLWVIPADTIRVIRDVPGLVSDIRFRPARGTQFRFQASRMSQGDVQLAVALADGRASLDGQEFGTRPEPDRARILDLSFEYLDYQRLSGHRAGEEAGPRLREIMLARARVDGPEPPAVPVPAVRPDEGHPSARFGVGGGVVDGTGFQELRFRGAYHDVIDPEAGYSRGAQIEFGNLVARHENGHGGLSLDRATLIDVTSLVPRDLLSRGPSWRFNVSMDRTRRDRGARPILYEISGGAGLTFAVTPRVWVYGLADLGTYFSPHLDRSASVGAGARTGVLLAVSDAWRLHLSARALRYLDAPDPRRGVASLESDVSLARNLGLRIEVSSHDEFGYRWRSVGAFLDGYF